PAAASASSVRSLPSGPPPIPSGVTRTPERPNGRVSRGSAMSGSSLSGWRDIQVQMEDIVGVVFALELPQAREVRTVGRGRERARVLIRTEVVEIAPRPGMRPDAGKALACPSHGRTFVSPIHPLSENEQIETGLPQGVGGRVDGDSRNCPV